MSGVIEAIYLLTWEWKQKERTHNSYSHAITFGSIGLPWTAMCELIQYVPVKVA